MSSTTETSQLLPMVLERLDLGERFRVLDAGPATPQTVEFFADYKCHLHFADLYDEAVLLEQDTLEPEDLEAHLEQTLSLRGDPFDLCLLWDAPNYLNANALRAFGNALRPFVHRRTLAHGFGAFKETQPFTTQRYSITGADQLLAQPATHPVGPKYPVTQNALVAALPFFTVVRGTLMADGRVELFLEAV